MALPHPSNPPAPKLREGLVSLDLPRVPFSFWQTLHCGGTASVVELHLPPPHVFWGPVQPPGQATGPGGGPENRGSWLPSPMVWSPPPGRPVGSAPHPLVSQLPEPSPLFLDPLPLLTFLLLFPFPHLSPNPFPFPPLLPGIQPLTVTLSLRLFTFTLVLAASTSGQDEEPFRVAAASGGPRHPGRPHR